MPTLFKSEATTETDELESAEVVEIDLDAEVVAEHPDADINALIPQPPAGIYMVRAKLKDRGESANPYPSQTKDKKPFVGMGLELEIVDESSEFHGFKLYDSFNSLTWGTRGTSPVHHFMACIGEVLPSTISIRNLMEKIKSALETPPLVPVEIQWKASRKSGQGKYDWEEVAKRMIDFPKDKESDGYSQIYPWKNPKTGEVLELRANAYIAKYLQQS